MNKKKNYYLKKIHNYLLILKNGLGIISRFKIPSLIFFLITIILALVFSSLFEINQQLNNQFKKSELNKYNPNKIYSLKKEYLNNQQHKNIFCNDYTEIKTENTIKRFPYYSFGNGGCFKEINKENINVSIKYDETLKRHVVNEIKIDKKHFQINYKSIFYKDSIHYKLLKKYKETGYKKYKETADKLIRLFLYDEKKSDKKYEYLLKEITKLLYNKKPGDKNYEKFKKLEKKYLLHFEKVGIKRIVEEDFKKRLNLFLAHNKNKITNENYSFLKKNLNDINNLNLNDFINFIKIKINKDIIDNFNKKNIEDIKKENKEKIINDWKKFKILLYEIKNKNISPFSNIKNEEKNEFKNKLLNLLKKENELFIISKRTKELIETKINNFIENNEKNLAIFINIFIEMIEIIEKNKTINEYEQKLLNIILSNYFNLKIKIYSKLQKNKIINFLIKIKTINKYKEELNLTNENTLISNELGNESYNLNEIIKNPEQYEKYINIEYINRYIEWLKNLKIIKNSLFYKKDKIFLENIKWLNKINEKNPNFTKINIEINFKQLINKYSDESFEKTKKILNLIEEKKFKINFWIKKMLFNIQKNINYWKWINFIEWYSLNFNQQIIFNIKENEIIKGIKELKNYLNIKKNNFNEKIIIIKSLLNKIEDISNNLFEKFEKFSEDLKIKEIEDIKKVFEIKKNFYNKLNFFNLLNFLFIKYLIKNNVFNENDKIKISTFINLILKKIIASKQKEEFIKYDSFLSIYSPLIEWNSIYKNFIINRIKEERPNLSETLNLNNLKLKNLEEKLEEIINEEINNENKDELIKTYKNFKKHIKILKKENIDFNILKFEKEFKVKKKIENNFFINQIKSNLSINLEKNKNIFNKNIIFFNSEKEQTIEEKFKTLILYKKDLINDLGMQNPEIFKNNYINNYFSGKEIDLNFIFKKNSKIIIDNFWKEINKNEEIKSKLKNIKFEIFNSKDNENIYGRYLKLSYILNEEKNKLNKEEKEKLTIILKNLEEKIIEKNIKNLIFWKNNNFFLYNSVFGKGKNPFIRQTKNKEKTDFLHKTIAKINNIQYKRMHSNLVYDVSKKITILIVQTGKNDNNFKLHLTKGNAPMFKNEIVISPIYAKNNNIKIGDTFEMLERKFKIVGFGSQTQFIFPGGNPIIPLDIKKNVIVYINKNFQEKMWWITKNLKTPLQIFSYHHVFLTGKESDIENFQKDLLINKNNFTDLTLDLNKIKNDKEYKTIDDNYQNLKLNNFKEKVDNFNFSLLNQVTNMIKKSLNITSILVCLLILFVWIFSALNLIKRKIKEVKKEFGCLKAQGIKNYELLFSYFGLLPPIFFSVIIGIIIGFFIQKFIFNKINEYLVLNFEFFKLSLESFVFPIIFIPLIFIFFIIFLNWKNFSKKKIIDLVKTSDETVSSFLEIKIKNFFINKFINKKNVMLKINFIFFLTIWKKILVLFFIIFFFSCNLIGTIYLLRLPTVTIEKQFKKINHNFSLKIKTPIWNNPFTFSKPYYIGTMDDFLKKMKEGKDLGLYPIEKIVPRIYYSTEKNKKDYKLYWEPGLKTEESFKNLIVFHSPLYNMAFNFEYIKYLFNGLNKKNKKLFCDLITKNILDHLNKKKSDKNINSSCLNELSKLSIPIKNKLTDEENEILKNHSPLSIQRTKYNKENDLISLTIDGKMKNNKKQNFYIIGVKKNNDVFIHDWKKEWEKKEYDNTVNIVVNQKFMDMYNYKIGDIIEIKFKQKTLYNKEKKDPYTKKDWTYLPIGKKINNFNKNEEQNLWKLNWNTKFYKGSMINDLKNFNVDKNTGQIYKIDKKKNKTKVTLYNKYFDEGTKKWKYIQMIDLERIMLYQNKTDSIRIFLNDEFKYGNNQLKYPNTWWDINNKKSLYIKDDWKTPEINGKKIKFLITNKFDTYEKPEIFIEQEKLNVIVGYGESSKKEFYIGDTQFFNTLYSKSNSLTESLMYGMSFSDENGFFDIGTVEGTGITDKLNINMDSELIKKESILIFLKYFLNLTLFSIILNIISSLFLLWFILKGMFEEFKKLTIDLKIIGYSDKELMIQIISIIFFPIILSFFTGSIVIRFLSGLIIEFVKNYSFYLFIDEGIWIFIITFLIIFISLLIIFRKYWKEFQNINFSEYLRM